MKKKILVVDNHPVIIEFMTRLLTKEGHQVLTALDGLTALDILKSFTPDAVFIDLIMPNIDGRKLCQVIRGIPRLRDAYLIILSAVALEEEIHFSALGADACVAKGPLNKMGQSVLEALEQADRKREKPATGKILGAEGIYSRQITKELLSVKKHYETILNTLAEGILEITPEGRVVYANPTAVELSGVTEDNLLASHVADLFSGEDRAKFREILDQVLSTSRVLAEETPLKLDARQVLVKILPVREGDQKTLIIVIDDVSDRKRMETQLQQAQKMEAIGTLAGGIAHDFNNLLMVVQGNISLMLFDMEQSHPHFDRLKNIEKQVQSGSRLTSQLLGYARKGRYEVRPLDFNQLLSDTAETFGRTRKDIVIHSNLGADLLPIEADAGQIEQVLMNLFVNASDAMPAGGDLYLGTANTESDFMRDKLYSPKSGHYVMLTVTDTGVGMDTKTMERIFEPFFTTKEMGRGTGLGLASVYGIVKGHGGFIDVESEKGKGTTFKIYLPASRKKVTKTAEIVEPIRRGRETVLLVDDEEMMLEVGRDLLRAMGYQVLTANSGTAAVEIYQERKDGIDLVLLDLVMPQMGGSEAFDRLKKINPEVKVLLLSGYSIDGEASKVIDRGCSGFIQKPFNMEQLSRSIKSVAAGRRAPQLRAVGGEQKKQARGEKA